MARARGWDTRPGTLGFAAVLALLGSVPSHAGGCFGVCGDLVWSARADVISVSGAGEGVEGAAVSIIGNSMYVSHGYSLGDNMALRIYDIPTDTWVLGPSAAVLRSEGGGFALNGRHYAIGGRPNGAAPTAPTAVEIYDPATSLWTAGASMPTGRKGMGFGGINGLLHVVGGSDGTGGPASGVPMAVHEVYDPVTDTWSSAAPLPVRLADVNATVAIGSKLYVFGGWDVAAAVNTTWIYDSATDTWSSGAAMPTARYSAAAAVLAGRAVVIGGYNGLQNLDVVEVYDPAADSWCVGPAKPRPSSETGTGVIATASEIHVVGSGAFGLSNVMHDVLTLGGSPPTPLAPPGDICAGSSYDLDATGSTGCAPGGYLYQWLDGATVVCPWSATPACSVSPTATTTYTLEVACAVTPTCTASLPVTVTVGAIPTPVALPGSICAGASFDLDGSGTTGCTPGGTQYRWLDGATVVCAWSSTPTCSVSPTTTTTYTLEVACAASPTCVASRTATVTVGAIPTPAAVSGSICAGQSFSLDGSTSTGCAPGGTLYRWLDGATVVCGWSSTPTCSVSPTTTTVYTLEVACAVSPTCTAARSATVTVSPLPVAAAPDANVCVDRPFVLDGTTSTGCPPGGFLYRWLNGATVVCGWSATPTCNVIPAATTTYTLEVTCAVSPTCIDNDGVTITTRLCPLAVRWDSYQAVAGLTAAGAGVEVRFRTLEELDTVGFVVERSTRETGPFVTVGRLVDARGAGYDYRVPDADGRAGHWYRVIEYTSNGPGDETPAFQARAAGGSTPRGTDGGRSRRLRTR